MLILCEKPSVAKDFAAALGAAGKKGYYEGNGTVITYCVGHLYELWSPERYDPKYKKWSLADLPIIPDPFKYQVQEGVKEQAECVRKLLAAHAQDEVLIATDAGREGELIARIVLQEAGIADFSRFRRFWVSEALTPAVIKEGIRNAKPLAEYDHLAAGGFARQHADWLVGMNLTRLMSIGNPPPPFSVGRVQTAVLAAIAARDAEIRNFVKTPYKELEARIRSQDQVIVTALLENPATGKSPFVAGDEAALRTVHETYAPALAENRFPPIDTAEVKSEQKTQKPEKLLNITALQKTAYKRFGYKPDDTLNIAQELYETRKCLSYPRTPSRVMGDNNVDLFLEKFERLQSTSPLSTLCDVSLIAPDNKHIFNSAQLEDHHALIPLGPLPEGVSEKERNVYGIVLESFFMVCMPDFIYTEKSLRFHLGTAVFTATIRENTRRGWKEAVQADRDEDEGPDVPPFNEEGCILTALTIRDKTTEPKKPYSLDTLLAFMEHPREEGEGKLAGLGTPATRADSIKTLFTREYVVETKKKLSVSPRGLFLLEQLGKDEYLKKMADITQTTEWEQRLADNPGVFKKEITEYIRSCNKTDAARAVFRKEPLGTCPLCGRPVVETKIGYGCSGYREDPKCPFVIWKTVAGAAITPDDAKLLLSGQKTKPKKCIKKDGTPFETAFALEGGKVIFQFKSRE
ncbi:MAG: DNA topoisomerase [Treponema sp.]|jgi:DNA topoisomerase-3|nr:DNA topoisomerase [Treponema sp.]